MTIEQTEILQLIVNLAKQVALHPKTPVTAISTNFGNGDPSTIQEIIVKLNSLHPVLKLEKSYLHSGTRITTLMLTVSAFCVPEFDTHEVATIFVVLAS